MIKPARLQAGARVAAVSLSWGGPGTFPHRYEAGKRQLEKAGLVSFYGPSIMAGFAENGGCPPTWSNRYAGRCSQATQSAR